jgi:signal transduction histidine kinase
MRPRLATKFLWTILGIVGLSVLSSLVTLYSAWRIDLRLEQAERESVPAARAEDVQRAEARVRMTTWVVGTSAALSLVLSGFLLWLFFYRVLFPLRGMVADAELFRGDRPDKPPDSGDDELRLMGSHLRNLMSDVSDTRSRLEQSRDRLMAAEKLASVGKLAASVAHEIRNPLTAIKMWLFTIREAADGNAELDRKLGIIAEEVERLESIVRNLLEFSRPPALDTRPHSIAEMIEQTLVLISPRLAERRIHVLQPMEKGLPPVIADASQFRQVLLNLFENAIDAMPEGGEIRVSTTAETDAGGQSMEVVRVRDTGHGMPPDVQRRVFEPFFTTKELGTGLGLCIAARVMARHGGALVLESSTEKGTCFAVWVPAANEGGNGQDTRR